MIARIASALLLLSLIAVPATFGQMADEEASAGTDGFYVGFTLNGTSFAVDGLDDDDTVRGGGGSLTIGYGITPNISIFLTGTSANMNPDEGDPYFLTHGDLGVRYLFASPGRDFAPFLELAATGRVATQEDVSFGGGGGSDDLELSGAGFTAGGGFLYFFSSGWALTTRLDWTSGEFTTIKYGNVSIDGFEVDATTVRFDVGVTWFPGR